MIPLRTDSPLRQTPYMNWALIAANVVVFMVTMAHPHLEARYALSPRQPLVYQYFTYAFLHADLLHIGGNMLFLYIFGNNVNDRMGHLGYLAFYLAGSVFAGLAYVATEHQAVHMVGASGAIAAVTGAFLVLLPRSNVTIVYYWMLIGMAEIPSLWFVLFSFAYDVFLNARGGDQVAHVAHIGGTIYGFIICVVLLSFHLLPRDQFDVVALIQRWNRRRQYRDMVSKGYNPWDYTQARPPAGGRAAPQPPPPSPVMQQVFDVRAKISDALAVHDLDLAAKLYIELKQIDATQVLARQSQLDVANHLASQQLYPQAAEAYESFLRQYPKYEQIEQVQLMLGLIYARYLAKQDRARECLTAAIARLHGERELSMAREELARIEAIGATRPAGG